MNYFLQQRECRAENHGTVGFTECMLESLELFGLSGDGFSPFLSLLGAVSESTSDSPCSNRLYKKGWLSRRSGRVESTHVTEFLTGVVLGDTGIAPGYYGYLRHR